MNARGSDEGTPSLSVLIVDDNEINRFYLLHALRKMGHNPVAAEDGGQAVTLFSSQPFDLVFMDVQLPDMDGLALTRLIREGRAGARNDARIPIVALTAFASREDRDRCRAAGMDEHLAKPASSADIAVAIARVLAATPRHADASSEDAGGFDLQAFTRESNREFAEEMLSLFLELAEPKRLALARAVERGDVAAAAPLAHDLAGMAGPIRATRLHAAMKAVQEACGAGSLDPCRTRHAVADRELAAVLAAVRSHPLLADRAT
ncbi:response regulator [Solidesulfovibrio alcoholivorans]|uniref:response regulator n=1 Tax=Solidesulfovibrio alcoholivorans TaxID=81406 RepID=UPI0004960639|nr:response regulator [Solidesulfovibrio alcoholivorans]